MSASMETRFVAQTRLAKMGAQSLARLSDRYFGFATRRQRVGEVSVWDGEARFCLPGWGLRKFFRVSLYVTVRRAPEETSDGRAKAKS